MKCKYHDLLITGRFDLAALDVDRVDRAVSRTVGPRFTSGLVS